MAVQEKDRVDGLLKEGRSALKAGDRDTASLRFRKAAELSPYDERVWQALLDVVSEPEDEAVCLENILAINPKNNKAKKRLAELRPEPAPSADGAAPVAAAAVAVAAASATPAPSPDQIQAEAEAAFAAREARKRARRRRWRAFRNGFGQGLLVGFAGMLIGFVLSLFIYGIGGGGGVLDVWFAPIRALFQ
jgi:hypothetical protein